MIQVVYVGNRWEKRGVGETHIFFWLMIELTKIVPGREK